MKNIKFITEFNIDNIKSLILDNDLVWDFTDSRHGYLKSGPASIVHRNSSVITLIDFPLNWKGNSYPIEYKFYSKQLQKELIPIIECLEKYHEGKVGRCLLVNLKANSNIEPHIDPGFYLTNCKRNHIPIITNSKVIFTVGDDSIHMPTGSCYEIDNTVLHSVVNASNDSRIHIIIDIIPNKFLS